MWTYFSFRWCFCFVYQGNIFSTSVFNVLQTFFSDLSNDTHKNFMDSFCFIIRSFILQKQPQEIFYKKSCLQKFWSIHRKKPVMESVFNKATGLKTCTFIKTNHQHRRFPVNITEFLRTPILKNEGLLLILARILHVTKQAMYIFMGVKEICCIRDMRVFLRSLTYKRSKRHTNIDLWEIPQVTTFYCGMCFNITSFCCEIYFNVISCLKESFLFNCSCYLLYHIIQAF